MILRSIELKNFRLHKYTNLEFSDNLNFIIGGNGQGKTTILEAAYYLCTTKNLIQNSDADAVSFGENFFEINGRFEDNSATVVKTIFDSSSNRKSYFLGEKQIFRPVSIIGKFPVVVIVQSDRAITMGSPVERRKFFDSVISQSSAAYLKNLMDYNKILRQRSALLSQIRETRDMSLLSQLDAWSASLIKLGSRIVIGRIKFLKEFDRYIRDSYSKIMEEMETPSIDYSFLNSTDPEKIETLFSDALNDARDEELRRAANLVGPHRDEFIFKINDLILRKFGSQGQHKTFQIALRFGQFFYLKEKLNRTPIFLMDDVFGELDTYRAAKISAYLKNIGQAFITMTDFSNIENLNVSDSDKKFEVKCGEAVYD